MGFVSLNSKPRRFFSEASAEIHCLLLVKKKTFPRGTSLLVGQTDPPTLPTRHRERIHTVFPRVPRVCRKRRRRRSQNGDRDRQAQAAEYWPNRAMVHPREVVFSIFCHEEWGSELGISEQSNQALCRTWPASRLVLSKTLCFTVF